MSFPEDLKKRRIKLGRSLRAAAEASGLSNPYLCKMEASPDAALLRTSWLTIRKLCKAYDIDPYKVDTQLTRIAKREKQL